MINIRLAAKSDAEAVRQIYNHYVENSVSTFDMVPRTLEQQEAWILERSGALAVIVAVDDAGTSTGPRRGGGAGIVASTQILGFASLSPYKDRPAYRTTVEDSVYVSPGLARRGVGRLLMTHLLQVATEHGYHAVMARIASSSEPSVALHTAVGFTVVGVEKEVGRKFGKWLDVTVMQRLL